MDSLIKLEGVSKGFEHINLFNDINISIKQGQFIALRGRSGSGKTTLLNLIGALDQPTEGKIYIAGNDIRTLNDKDRTELRRNYMGFVFQSYGLFPLLSVGENIEFGLRLAKANRNERQVRVQEAAELVGLSNRLQHRPYELSGGEQQRVAIARALAITPKILLADEPTAELDTKTGFKMIRTFQELVNKKGTTIIMTTHDPAILELIEHIYTLEDKQINYEKKQITI